MRHVSILLVSSLVLLIFFANTDRALSQQELTVSAAASLTNAFGEIGKKFEASNPGAKVIFNFGASGALLQQMEISKRN